MSTVPSQPPVLSTPETHILEEPTLSLTTQDSPRYTDAEIWDVYEISRTAAEIRNGGYRRVALQFPDGMLRDAPRVFEELERELKKTPSREENVNEQKKSLEANFTEISISSTPQNTEVTADGSLQIAQKDREDRVRLYILADTSYGSCCVDEIAAEHADADVVVHYGRSCLSPTARLPVIYVFTTRPLVLENVIRVFEETFPEKDTKVCLMADITYHRNITAIRDKLVNNGYENLKTPEIIHDPSSLIPNRKVEEDWELKDYALFHISDPPPALLLTLSSRVKEMHIYPTTTSSTTPSAIQMNTSMALRRRYGLLTSLTTTPIFGILINTLSVKNYLQTATQIQTLLSKAGKKSYTFVVGKVNAAKIANFSEIGGWVVIGCWESSLVESKEFYRPIITPFELSLALQGDKERVWDGSWRGDFGGLETLTNPPITIEAEKEESTQEAIPPNDKGHERMEVEDEDSESESEPPEFDLRTGRYVSHSRPMRTTTSLPTPSVVQTDSTPEPASNVLARRAKGDVATINGAVSPGAEYLRSQRTWTGLGSDFHETDASNVIEEGRSGVARGYVVGEGEERR